MQVTFTFFQKKIILSLLIKLSTGFLLHASEKKISYLKDTLPVSISQPTPINKQKEPAAVKKHSPRTAAIRSAILPGLGQIYNKKYWKLPIVYGALGATGVIFLYSLNNYRDTRFAYSAKYKASLPPPLRDSTDYYKIKPELLPLTQESLRSYRDQFRRDVDYWAIYFLVAWALNVVDATVDAHLKTFDVSPDLSFQIKPGRSELAGTNGISLVLHIGKNSSR